VNLIIQIARLPGGKRRVVNISEVTGMEGDTISMHEIFLFVQTGMENDDAVGHFETTGIRRWQSARTIAFPAWTKYWTL